MSPEAQSFLQIERALLWIVDHPTAYPRAVARSRDCDYDTLKAWLEKNGPPDAAKIAAAKRELGLLSTASAGVTKTKPSPPLQIPAPALEPPPKRTWSRRPKTAAPGFSLPPAPPAIDAPETVRVKLIVEVEVRVRTITVPE